MKSNLPAALILASSALLISPKPERVLAQHFSPEEQLVASTTTVVVEGAEHVTKAGVFTVVAGFYTQNPLVAWGGTVVACLGLGTILAVKG